MEYIGYILKMFYYFLFAIVMYSIALYGNKKFYRTNITKISNKLEILIISKRRISFFAIMMLCLMAGYYGTICGQTPISSDRLNYALRFSSEIYTESVRERSYGLFFLESILHLFSYDPYILFFTIPVVCLALYLKAYNEWNDVTPLAILLLGMSACINYSFYQYKQAPALGLMALSFCFFLREKNIYAISYLIGAIAFHKSAFAMIPLYLVMQVSGRRWVIIFEILFLLVCLFGFKYINIVLVKMVSYIPGFAVILQSYIDETGGIRLQSNIATIVKGLPYYIITIVGLLKRRELKDSIKGYDQYLTMSIYASACILLSAHMYWMWRFGSYVYFPILIFASLIHREMGHNREIFKWAILISLSFFTFLAFAQFYFIYGGY